MAVSYIELDRLRRDIGVGIEILNDADAQAIFDEAAELYAGVASRRAGARVIGLNMMIAQSTSLVDYAQDTTQESQSQVFDHLLALLKFWQTELNQAQVNEQVSSANARSMRVPVIAVW